MVDTGNDAGQPDTELLGNIAVGCKTRGCWTGRMLKLGCGTEELKQIWGS